MKILLDTHIFLWFISGDTKLPADFKAAIRNPDNEVYLSVISVWEATIKYQLDKLPLPEHPTTYLPKQRDFHHIASLSLDESSVAQLAEIPPLHRDPFDRMLICQALQKNCTIATVDAEVLRYPVRFL